MVSHGEMQTEGGCTKVLFDRDCRPLLPRVLTMDLSVADLVGRMPRQSLGELDWLLRHRVVPVVGRCRRSRNLVRDGFECDVLLLVDGRAAEDDARQPGALTLVKGVLEIASPGEEAHQESAARGGGRIQSSPMTKRAGEQTVEGRRTGGIPRREETKRRAGPCEGRHRRRRLWKDDRVTW
jgi:hypothetical protein